MTDFLRDMRITELKSKASYWTLAKINEFHGNKVKNLTKPVAFEPYANGYLSITESAIEYVDVTTGITYKVKKAISEKEWACVTALYSKSAGSFRMENPSFRTVSGTVEYLELTPPSSNFGDTLFNVSRSADLNAYKITLMSLIDFIALVFAAAKEVAAEKKTGIPAGIFDPQNYWKDSDGWFVTGLDQGWTTPSNTAKEMGLAYITMSKSIGADESTRTVLDEIKEYARTRWN